MSEQTPPTVGHNGPLTTGFDYGRLPPEIVQDAQDDTVLIQSCLKRIGFEIFTFGAALIRQKDRLGRGYWLPWLNAETGFSEDTAERFMRVFRTLSGDEFRTVRNSGLQLTTLYALAGAPEGVRYQIAEAINNGAAGGDPVLDAEIKRRIEDAKSGGIIVRDTTAAREARQREAAVEFTKRIKERFLPAEFEGLVKLYNRAVGPILGEVLRARKPNYVHGLITGELVMNGVPLTDKQLRDYQLNRDSTPPAKTK